MGWNSWNHFGTRVTDDDIRRAADAISVNGMRQAGYEYVNIDDGWQGGRDANGKLLPNEHFPDMRALADYVHGKGLKLGIYSSPGSKTCAGFQGGMGHEDQDAQTFAAWGVDYLKYDICSYRQVLEQQAKNDPEFAKTLMIDVYRRMSRALAAAGRPMVYSVSQHGISEIWRWGPAIGANLWRVGDDVRDNYLSVSEIGFSQAGLANFASSGHWNDPDMLEVGNGGLSADEAKTQISLWALLAAPLLAGNDLQAMSPQDLNILTNSEVIAIDQDNASRQGDRVWSQGPVEVWSRDLAGGKKAIGLFNRNASSLNITLDLASLHWRSAVYVRDVWEHRDLPAFRAAKQFLVPRHGVVLLVMSEEAEAGRSSLASPYRADSPGVHAP